MFGINLPVLGLVSKSRRNQKYLKLIKDFPASNEVGNF